jgi:uncharacterized membrane-anchored protein YitT (DUF2179 family)
MLYRILTENKNRKQIIKLVSDRFDGFTVIKTQGYWKGQTERSLIIEINTNAEWEIKEICQEIRDYNKQECVMLQKILTNTEFI